MPPSDQGVLFADRPPARPLRLGRAEVYVGTCSWADPHFVREGGFYPRGVRSKADLRLRYYASVFPTVELDATYYALLPPDLARRYAEWTPPGFLLHVKAFGLLTGHGADPRRLPPHIQAFLPAELLRKPRIRREEIPEEAETLCWEAFLEFLRTLRETGRLGYVLFQFPRWTPFSPETLKALERTRTVLEGYRVAVEFRHRSWLESQNRQKTLDALRALDLIYTVPDAPDLPWTVPPEVAVTSSWSAVRFHGRNAAAWSRRGATTLEVYDYLYSEEELRPWAQQARSLAREVDRLFLMFNNHVRGASAKNARMLLRLLQEP
ncbi:MAG: DUF72 domain-containing protein [Armatimonadota bacterium]|nr:DUF72 domain-containing protein [Armatimonadota bacterium]MDR7563482.1 DUF72 domain-containing protein [Armatimonadota bacterium]MDR7568729.1 DUF72 domain-containing protein [Armatimonadota bacterium]MDR7601617.1 DUF72 domain-containing protein [Armatimonadota bacterium]